MSKTIEAVGLAVVGIGAAAVGALVPGMQWMVGLGVSTALAGIGVALRPAPPLGGPATTLTFNNGPAPRRVIYGHFETAGVLTYASFPPSGNQNTDAQYLHLVYTLCAHEIASFDGISINGTPYNFGSDLVFGPPAGFDTLWHIYPNNSTQFNDAYWQHMFFEFDFGRANGPTPFPNLTAADPSWTSACVQTNCAKVHVILRADSGVTQLYPAGQIPNIKFLVTGKKIFDPRVSTAWEASTGYSQYNYIIDNFALGRIWVQTNSSGTSGAIRPNFEGASSYPATLSDGTCSWTCYNGEYWSSASQGIDGSPQGHLVDGRLVNNAWAPGTGFLMNGIIEAPVGYLQMATNAGTSGTSEPNFSLTRGGTTSDNTQSWVCLGRSWYATNFANPALNVNDYLRDKDFGMNAGDLAGDEALLIPTPSSIDESSVIAAANVCETPTLIIWNSDNTVVYEDLYACRGVFDQSSTRGNVLGSLVASMAGWVVPPGDMWHVFAGSYTAPTVALGDADMRGAMKGDFRLSRRDVANSVRGKFNPAYMPPNPAAIVSLTMLPGLWQSQPYPAYQANGMAGKPDYIDTEDGGQIIWMDLDLDFVTSIWQAQRLAKIAMMKTRFQARLHLQCKLSAFQLEAGDTFELTHLNWGFSAVPFWVQQSSLTLDESKAGTGKNGEDQSPAIGVDLVAWETDPSIYEFTAPSSSTDFGEYSPYGITGVMTGVE